jgi:preprotein translocase subunit SecF
MRKTIPFLKTKKLTLFLSTAAIIALFAVTFMRGGFNLGIDFKAGMSITVTLESSDYNVEQVSEALADVPNVSVQQAEGSSYIIRIADSGEAGFRENTEAAVESGLRRAFGNITVESSEFIDSSYSGSLIIGTIVVVVAALLVTTIYLLFRFQKNYAIAAFISTVHDILFMVGFIGAMQFEFNMVAIAAVLTIMGYSLNDTIVIFDRIRESMRLNTAAKSYADLINQSITQTLDRTLATSISTMLALVPLVVFTSGSIYLFAVEVLFGIVIGSYSSVFIASITLNELHEKNAKKAAQNIKK